MHGKRGSGLLSLPTSNACDCALTPAEEALLLKNYSACISSATIGLKKRRETYLSGEKKNRRRQIARRTHQLQWHRKKQKPRGPLKARKLSKSRSSHLTVTQLPTGGRIPLLEPSTP